ncbi:MAG: type VI secretion system ImpA family N-terminal domain-containing protein [Planctomycetes bacterium]|nr:type VI secretion system ImpA family N-terminal domain-containing protein [Planctomycetota bacterium]MCW8135163.1 type VI secretion system ImpA family N-terminal domain-containing protein [Planctomycetota bacterium]
MAEPVTHPLGENPIPGSKPAGENARYEPEFERLQGEVSKLENPAGGEIKWSEVVDLSRQILEGKSKDLLVGAYYAYAMLQQQGYQGLLDGLAVLYSMCSAHWDAGMFPDRPRARESALDWLIDRVQPHLENGAPPARGEAEILQSAVATMDALGQFVNSKLETPNPKLPAMSRSLSAKAGQAAGGGAGGNGASEAPSGRKGQTVMISAAGGAITNRKVAFERLKEVADFLRKTEPHSPVSYLVNRAVKWGDMPLESVLAELVKNTDVRKQILETLGLKEEH